MSLNSILNLKSYVQFIDENYGELFKVYFAYKDKSDEEDFSFKEYMCKKFALPLVEKTLDYQINQNYPIINYNSDLVRYLIKYGLIKKDNVYNKPEFIIDVASKVRFHKKMKDSVFVPKTVFDKEDAIKFLKFPIIAKPDNRHSGRGIQIFKNKFEFKDNDEKFDIFSEYKKIKEEYRILFFKAKPILLMRREPLNSKAKDGVGTTEEEMVFGYRKMHINYVPNKLEDIIKEVREKFKNVDFYALDIMQDEDGNYYIIEINSQPGLPFDSTVMLYKEVYNDFYEKKLSQKAEYDLNIFAEDLNKITVRNNNNFIIDK